jgi:hypothetical protein
MPPFFVRQNIQANVVNHHPEQNPQRGAFFSRILNALSPCSANRSVLNSVVTTPTHLRNPEDTVHVNDLSVGHSQGIERDHERQLRVWIHAAPQAERVARKEAANRIRLCINQRQSSLSLARLNLTSLPEDVLKSISWRLMLNISSNNLETIDFSGFRNLFRLDCNFNGRMFNGASTLNLSDCHNLRVVRVIGSTFSHINFTGSSQLSFFSCTLCRFLQSIDLSTCTNLQQFIAADSGLTQVTWPMGPDLAALALRLADLNARIERDRALPEMADAVAATQRELAEVRGRMLEQTPVRHLELRNTHITLDQLPAAIGENQNMYIDLRFMLQNHQENPARNNNPQNTHTQSVHSSASATAIKLKGDHSAIDTNQAYRAFSRWVTHLPTENAQIVDGYANDSFKNQAAQEWIQNPEHLDYKDPQSNVTVQEFLAFAWTAIQDKKDQTSVQREFDVSLEDAKAALRDALYEIGRGYNLNEDHKPKDNGGPASHICRSGTFNKIAEKLVSVVKGVSVTMLTQETFALSLENTIRQEIAKVIEEDPKQAESLASNEGLLTEDIWQMIEPKVKSAILTEFKVESRIGGKPMDQMFNERTQFKGVLEYFSVKPSEEPT